MADFCGFFATQTRTQPGPRPGPTRTHRSDAAACGWPCALRDTACPRATMPLRPPAALHQDPKDTDREERHHHHLSARRDHRGAEARMDRACEDGLQRRGDPVARRADQGSELPAFHRPHRSGSSGRHAGPRLVIPEGGGHYVEFCTPHHILEAVWVPEKAEWLPFRTKHVLPFLRAHAAIATANSIERLVQHFCPAPVDRSSDRVTPRPDHPSLPAALRRAARAASGA